MTLTPQDIQSQQFHVRFRGFDVDEVDVFLEKVAEDFLTLIQENKQLKERAESLVSELESFKHQEKTFQQAMITAQKIADEMKLKSEQAADKLIAQAQLEVKQLENEANREVTALEKRVDELKSMKGRIRSELETILQAYLARLDDFSAPGAKAAEAPPVQDLTEPRAESAGQEGESEAESPAEEDNTNEPDLSDLYTKIDFPDDLPVNETEDQEGHNGPVLLKAIPDDLDGEIMFNLEDPLDEGEGPEADADENWGPKKR